MTSKILVTGASGGFGQRTVLTLLQHGHAVAASMRDIAGKNAAMAAELRRAGATVVDMDVTDDASVDAGVKMATQALGDIDAVVNNAGVGVLGVQETFTPEDWKRLFDVNVFGVQRVNRAVLPAMRERGSGLLLQISSLLGRIAIPFYGPYNASKWAVEAMAENYRVELSGFGVDVAIIERTGLVEEVAHLARHVAESRWRAEHNRVVLREFHGTGLGKRGHTCPELLQHVVGQVFRHSLDRRVDTGYIVNAFRGGLRHAFDVPVQAVNEDEDLGHGAPWGEACAARTAV